MWSPEVHQLTDKITQSFHDRLLSVSLGSEEHSRHSHFKASIFKQYAEGCTRAWRARRRAGGGGGHVSARVKLSEPADGGQESAAGHVASARHA